MNTMRLQQPSGNWVLHSGVSSHMIADGGNLSSLYRLSTSSFVNVGNGSTIPIYFAGRTVLSTPTNNFVLDNVLDVSNLVKKLISVRQFTRDNSCLIDPLGFFVKDLHTQKRDFSLHRRW